MSKLTRKQINYKIALNKKSIQKLMDENDKLTKQSYLLSDKKQWFTEEYEERIISKRPKKVVKELVGRIRWIENYPDGDTGKIYEIERSRIVKIDGEWVV